MSTKVAALAVEVASDVAEAVSGLGHVDDAARGAGDGVAQMGRDAQESARKLNITADSADELGGKAGKATGALGALSSGFELVGAGKYAAGLQGAALATDFFSGVGDSLNLVMESTIVKTGLAKLQMVGHAVATGASAAASGVMTAAQWALNAAMSANPIALVVLGLVALTAAVVVAYKRSETFRRIVTGAFDAVRAAATGVFGFVRRTWPLLLGILTGPFIAGPVLIARNLGKIKTTAQNALSNARDWLRDAGRAIIQGFIDGIGDMFGSVKDKLGDLTGKLTSWKGPPDKDRRLLQPAGQLLMSGLITGIQSAIPDLRRTLADVTDTVAAVQPDLNGSLVVGVDASTSATSSGRAPAGGTVININVDGALDANAVARQIVDLLVRLARSLGIPVSQLFGAIA